MIMSASNPYAKPYHMADKISGRGVSPLCAKTPRAINLKRASWTLREEAVTCAKCLALIRERSGAGSGHTNAAPADAVSSSS